MKTILGVILIVAAIVLVYLGVTGLQESTAAVNILGLELKAEDTGAKEIAIVELVGSVLALFAGLYLLRGKKR